jgi:hypothetical protein
VLRTAVVAQVFLIVFATGSAVRDELGLVHLRQIIRLRLQLLQALQHQAGGVKGLVLLIAIQVDCSNVHHFVEVVGFRRTLLYVFLVSFLLSMGLGLSDVFVDEPILVVRAGVTCLLIVERAAWRLLVCDSVNARVQGYVVRV